MAARSPLRGARGASRWRPAFNSILGNEGVTVDGTHPSHQAAAPRKPCSSSSSGCARERPVLVYGVNPAYTLPPALGFAEALARVPFTLSFADRVARRRS
jgi:hypothetical protein